MRTQKQVTRIIHFVAILTPCRLSLRDMVLRDLRARCSAGFVLSSPGEGTVIVRLLFVPEVILQVLRIEGNGGRSPRWPDPVRTVSQSYGDYMLGGRDRNWRA